LKPIVRQYSLTARTGACPHEGADIESPAITSSSVARAPPAGAAPRAVSPRTQRILQAPVLATLLGLSLPNFLNLAAIAALITFDGVFLGRLSVDALAGVSLVFPFIMAVHHVANSGMGGAVSSAISRALGAADRGRASAYATHAFALAAGLGVFFSVLMLALGPLLYRWMGGRGEMLDAALAYSTVAFGGAIAICMLSILANVVRATGNMAFPALVQLGAVLGHVAVSPILIFGAGPFAGLGAAGAAWGFILSFGTGAAVIFVYLRSAGSPLKLALRGVRYRWELFREFFRIGVPGMANVAITNLTVVILTGVAGQLGKEAQLGYAIGARLDYIMIPLAFVFGTTLVTMVGTNWGAKQYARAKRIAWTGGAVAAAVCGTVGLTLAVFPALWMRLFTDDAEVISVGTLYLIAVAPAYALYGLGQALYCARQGIGRLLLPLLTNAARLTIAAGGGWLAVWWLGAGPLGLFAAITSSLVAYALFNSLIVLRTKEDS
jgi:putative MATE family efflux protein